MVIQRRRKTKNSTGVNFNTIF